MAESDLSPRFRSRGKNP